MASTLELVDQTINEYLMTGQRMARAKLGADLNASETDVTLANVQGGLYEGSVLQVGFEAMGVWSYVDPTASVQRGDYGSTAATHTTGDVAEIDPIFPRYRVLRAIQDELLVLDGDPSIYAPTVVSFTSDEPNDIYDLGANEIHGILDVDQLIDGVWAPADDWQVVRGLTGQPGYTGDVGLIINNGASGATTRVAYKGALGSIDENTADVAATVGLDILPLLAVGATLHLIAGREVKRTFIEHQGSARRANEVAPFQTLSSGRELEKLYKRLRTQLVSQLYSQYPLRRKRR